LVATKLRKGDKVVVISGPQRGQGGEIVKVIPDPIKGDHLLIRGINQKVHFVRPDPMAGQQGGIMKREGPIRASNVALADPVTGQRTRVGFKSVERVSETTNELERIKIRHSKRTGAEVD
jgi:large subunit ribosomal protein L24